MGAKKLFRIAFEEGCGIPFAEAQRSDEFLELVAREHAVYRRFPEESSEGRFLRVSHFEAGAIFQHCYEN